MTPWFENSVLCVLDVSARFPARATATPYAARSLDPGDMMWAFVHHTAGRVSAGLEGIKDTDRYCQAPKVFRMVQRANGTKARINVGGRGWPKIPYHFWVPYFTEVTDAGQLVVYLCCDLNSWSWHTGGKDHNGSSNNKHSVGIACQGCFSSASRPRIQPPDSRQFGNQPHPSQVLALQYLWAYALRPKFPLMQLSTHSRAGTGAKPTCPGLVMESVVDTLCSAGYAPDGN